MLPRFAKALLRLLFLALLAYLTVCAILYARQRKMMYHPESTHMPAAQTNFALQRPDVLLRGWQYKPPQAPSTAPTVIYFGGNADKVEHALPRLQQALPGTYIYTLAYRGFGASEGEPSETSLTEDAVALYDKVRQLHPQSPITVIGRSLGTAPASAVAGARKPAGLVLITPFDTMLATVSDMYPWLPVSLLLKDRYDSVSRLQSYTGPILVLRAEHDDLVPPPRTDALLASLRGKSVQTLTMAGTSHYNILRAQGLWPAIEQLVQQSTAGALQQR